MDEMNKNPWSEMYRNWPTRNEREAKALEMLAQAIDFQTIRKECGMSREEWRDFYTMFKKIGRTNIWIRLCMMS